LSVATPTFISGIVKIIDPLHDLFLVRFNSQPGSRVILRSDTSNRAGEIGTTDAESNVAARQHWQYAAAV
jgi:hypothetical protein